MLTYAEDTSPDGLDTVILRRITAPDVAVEPDCVKPPPRIGNVIPVTVALPTVLKETF
jgi:hypothetical protein